MDDSPALLWMSNKLLTAATVSARLPARPPATVLSMHCDVCIGSRGERKGGGGEGGSGEGQADVQSLLI
jgi:hypothetical protein